MHRHSRIAIQLCLFVLAAASPGLSQYQGQYQTVQSVRIAVLDTRTGQELTVLSPEDTLQLPQGEERTLRLFETPRSGRQDRRYLAAEFGFGATQTALEEVRHSVARGEVTIRLRAVGGQPSPGGRLHVGYRIDDDIDLANSDLRLGRVFVEVVAPNQWQGQGQGQGVDQVVAALYRGILLREPDASAAARRDDIARNGWTAVTRHAQQLAESRESQMDVYQRSCNQQRLLALYKQLLGRESAQIDQRVWRTQLRRLERGDIADVVDEMVDSREFQDRFNVRPRRGRRY